MTTYLFFSFLPSGGWGNTPTDKVVPQRTAVFMSRFHGNPFKRKAPPVKGPHIPESPNLHIIAYQIPGNMCKSRE